MTMEDESRDLAPLDPRLDADRWGRMLAAVEGAAAGELARRARRGDAPVLLLLSTWTRSTFTAGGALAAAAVVLLLLGQNPAPTEVAAGVADELGYPLAVSAWVETGYVPSTEELLASIAVEEQ